MQGWYATLGLSTMKGETWLPLELYPEQSGRSAKKLGKISDTILRHLSYCPFTHQASIEVSVQAATSMQLSGRKAA